MGLVEQYRAVRAHSEAICRELSAEDAMLQAMPDVSPAKWHLAHTTWFFETFLLQPHLPGYAAFHPQYRVLFNSYYQAVGPQFSRPQRGLLSRPSLREVLDYRAHVDAHMARLLQGLPAEDARRAVVELGLHHEQQHQELLVTDIKYNLSVNPLQPAWLPGEPPPPTPPPASAPRWISREGGLVEIGHPGAGFHFDNEAPRHRVYLEPYALRSAPATNAEYLAFVEEGGYRQPRLWLSDGWAWLQEHGIQAPLYWQQGEAGEGEGGCGWSTFTLYGRRPLDLHGPVTHLSGYEAEAFAAWAGARLPTEAEWEAAVADPRAGGAVAGVGEGWEWTRSAYLPYPGYRPAEGALGEYNGKFMSGQWVLRGGSCATPPGHARPTYRNFFSPHQRWQFTGIRLATGGGGHPG